MILKKGSISSYTVVSLLLFLSVTTVNAINPDFYCSRDCAKSAVCATKGGVWLGQCFSDNTCQCYCDNDRQQIMTPSGTTCVEGPGAATCNTQCASINHASLNSWCADSDNKYNCRCTNGNDYKTTTTCTPDVDQAQCTKSCKNYCATNYFGTSLSYSRCQYNAGDSRCVCYCEYPGASRDGEIMEDQYCGQDSDGLEPPVEGIFDDFKYLWEETVGPLACFSSETTVVVENSNQSGTTVRKISDIVAGDHVLTKNGQYETVYAIDHKEKYRPSNFVQIYHEQQKQPLEITKNHMVFLSAKTNDEVVASAAEMVKVGDKLQTISGPSTVTKIDTVVRNGLFNPLTASGSIVVNQGVVTSTFSSYELQNGERTQQSMMEKIMKPYKVACTSIGISLNWCQATGKLSEEKTLISRWAANVYGLWLNQKNETVRTISFSSLMIMTNIFHIIFSKTFTLMLVTLVLMTRKIALLSASKN